MRVLLVNPNITLQTYVPLGLAYISAVLKQAGHETSAFDTRISVKRNVEHDLGERIKSFKPDIVAISCREIDFERGLLVASIAKEHNAFVIAGGPYATAAPHELISFNEIDAVCIGEAEDAFVELAERMQKGKGFYSVKNFWFKEKGKIIRNPVRELRADIDSLPYPDWGVFMQESGKFEPTFLSSRGCPFNCTYCINNLLQKLYLGKGKYIRFRKAENILAEVKYCVKKYNVKLVNFVDDAFTVDKKRLKEFAEGYKKEIKVPFTIITRADMIDYATFKMLKEAGCESVAMGVESGSDFIREKVMKRRMPRETIVNAFKAAHKAGLYTYAFNIIGSPHETEKTIWETIELNREIRPGGAQVSIMAAFKGSDLYNYVKKKGWLSDKKFTGWFNESALSLPSISRRKLEAYHKTFAFYVYAPKYMYPFIHL
ncbi:MAG: B12-binding domain-containing radical SAM protein, partial [Candidatus Diapherotrites archaeon]|nr:B12-binding domain-containing radical SAM protein [Candidatus Diapherotrites archaeon]